MKSLGCFTLVLATLLPASSLVSQETNVNKKSLPTYIQVDGNEVNALKLLKAGGITAKEAKTQKVMMPEVTIGGNTGPVDYGDMVILSADFDANSLPDGLVDMKFNWTVLDEGKRKKFFGADKEIAFAVGVRPKSITVILDVNFLFENKEIVTVVDKDGKNPTQREVIKDAQSISPPPIFSQVVVGVGPAPKPPVIPTPVPNPIVPPAPTFPEGQFGLAKFTYDTFMADTNLDETSRAAIADKLATNLQGIASKIVSISSYKDVGTILADTKKGNDDAFASIPGLDLSRTEALKAAIRLNISKLYKDGKINNAGDISVAWSEMVIGLRQVK